VRRERVYCVCARGQYVSLSYPERPILGSARCLYGPKGRGVELFGERHGRSVGKYQDMQFASTILKSPRRTFSSLTNSTKSQRISIDIACKDGRGKEDILVVEHLPQVQLDRSLELAEFKSPSSKKLVWMHCPFVFFHFPCMWISSVPSLQFELTWTLKRLFIDI